MKKYREKFRDDFIISFYHNDYEKTIRLEKKSLKYVTAFVEGLRSILPFGKEINIEKL